MSTPTTCATASRRRVEVFYHRDAEGVFTPSIPVNHRDEEFDAAHFDLLLDLQDRHFWYRGRHRFLLRAVRHWSQKRLQSTASLEAIDLGGGCGGWIQYVNRHAPGMFDQFALADSSRRALQLAAPTMGRAVDRYQIDLKTLYWQDRWDAAFLLDVLEHIPDDAQVMKEITDALRPGGLLFVTAPALGCFWSYIDDLVRHVRRYSRHDFRHLAALAGLQLVDSRYFMTLLSPLLLLSRLRRPPIEQMTMEEINEHLRRTHRIPAAPINELLAQIFSLETPLGHWLPFPWGTSILGVFRKPKRIHPGDKES
jgi:SAM-dependent methyltransferase